MIEFERPSRGFQAAPGKLGGYTRSGTYGDFVGGRRARGGGGRGFFDLPVPKRPGGPTVPRIPFGRTWRPPWVYIFGVLYDLSRDWARQGSGGAPQYTNFTLEKTCAGTTGFPGTFACIGSITPPPPCSVVASTSQHFSFAAAAAACPGVGQRVTDNWDAALGQNLPHYWYIRTSAGPANPLPSGYVSPIPYTLPPQPSLDPWPAPEVDPDPRSLPRVVRSVPGYVIPAEEMSPGIVIVPRPATGPAARPGGGGAVSPPVVPPGSAGGVVGGGDTEVYRVPPRDHKMVPDGKKKIRVPPWFARLMGIYHGGTELLDAVDCMYKALPKQDQVHIGNLSGRSPTEHVHPGETGFQKASAVFEHFDAIDWSIALPCMAMNEAIDRSYVAGLKASQRGRGGYGGPTSTHFGFGRQMANMR